MARAVRVHRSEAERTRRRLLEMDLLRHDLEVARDGDDVLLPVVDSCGPRIATVEWPLKPRSTRPSGYQDLLAGPLRLRAPRAFDQLGDIIVVKVPEELWQERAAIGEALLRFHDARAVFHDGGVRGPYRVRALQRIAGTGDPLTSVQENGIRLEVDLSRAYYSPRLAAERAREAALVREGEHVVDLFGGVAPFAVQAALRGARVDCIDLNPEAVALGRRNVEANGVGHLVTLHEGDAREVAASLRGAHRIAMNLPHAALGFLDVAARIAAPGATLHLHTIVRDDEAEAVGRKAVKDLEALGRTAHVVLRRTVRNYSPTESHTVHDIVLG